MLLGFFPIAFAFLASYLLTLRWYERLGSIPALLLGAVAQPLFTALLYSIGVTCCGQLGHGEASFSFNVGFQSTLTVFSLFTIVIAVPLALLAAIPTGWRMRAQRPKEYYDSLEGFEVLLVIGAMSSVCAAAAVGGTGLLIAYYSP